MSLGDDPVVAYYQDSLAAIQALGTGEPSLASAIRTNLTKGLVLAAASSFESALMGHLEAVYRRLLAAAPALANFAVNTGMERRYHAYFDWDRPNANKLFGHFGPEFAERLKSRIAGEPDLEQGMRDFMSLGRLRNELAHDDFAAYSLDLTLEEVFSRYQSARRFLAELQMQTTWPKIEP